MAARNGKPTSRGRDIVRAGDDRCGAVPGVWRCRNGGIVTMMLGDRQGAIVISRAIVVMVVMIVFVRLRGGSPIEGSSGGRTKASG